MNINMDIEHENIYESEVENESINEEIEEYNKFEDNLNKNFDNLIENLRMPCFAHTLQLIVNLVMKSNTLNYSQSRLYTTTPPINKLNFDFAINEVIIKHFNKYFFYILN